MQTSPSGTGTGRTGSMAATEERAGVTSWTFAAADAVEHAGYSGGPDNGGVQGVARRLRSAELRRGSAGLRRARLGSPAGALRTGSGRAHRSVIGDHPAVPGGRLSSACAFMAAEEQAACVPRCYGPHPNPQSPVAGSSITNGHSRLKLGSKPCPVIAPMSPVSPIAISQSSAIGR